MASEPASVYRETREARKIIVVALGFLGDSIHLIPALWEIKRNYPAAELHVVTTPLGGEVVRLVPCVHQVWSVARNPKQSTWRGDWATVKTMWRERFDLAINLSSSDRTILWTFLTGARCRVAHTGPRKPFWRTWLIPHWVPRQLPEMPIAEQHLQVLAACGLSLSAPRWNFSLSEEAKRKAEALVSAGAVHLSVSASAALKEWPIENWIGLAKRLLERHPHLRLLATGSPLPREQERVQLLAGAVASERLTTLSGLSISELAAVLLRCQLHVGADSGVLHLAVAVGLPTISLFRDYQDASAWRPAGTMHRTFSMPCVCVNRSVQPCAAKNRADCLARLEVNEIEAAVNELLGKIKEPATVTPSDIDTKDRLPRGGIDQHMDATIVIPVHNQLHFTQQCLDSLNTAGYADTMIVVVNNASTDGTAEFLANRPGLRVITNVENRACAAAWNQGFQTSTTRWTVFLNNDTVTPPGWLESLIVFAEKEGLAVASPAMGEGELDYALNSFAHEFTAQMKNVTRRGRASGACFMVARDVFAITGGFDENFTRGGSEDDDFFWRVRAAGLKLASGGCTYIHHFGSMTRNAVAAERGSHRAETVGYFRRKWKIYWARRRWLHLRRKTIEAWWVWNERLRHGHTLREYRHGGKLFFR